MLRAALYARFSSENQREESIIAQFRDSSDYCKRHDYKIVARYADTAKSGTTTVGRDQYKAMLRDAQKGKFDVVVFHKIDRNARNELDYYLTKHKLEEAGVKYAYSRQDIDSSSPEGQMMESMLVGMAAYYSRNLSNEIKKGLRENAFQGKSTGGRAPYGFSTDSEKRLIINEKEAPAIRSIFEWYAGGAPYAIIRERLFNAGYRNRAGKEFPITAIYEILHNRKYVGDLALGKTFHRKGKRNTHQINPDVQYFENVIPAIISRDLFEEVQEKMERNKKRSGSGNAKAIYALSGLIFCGECGAAMVAHNTKNSRGIKNYYYRCPHSRLVGDEKCPQRMINRDYIEGEIYNLIRNIFTSADARDRIKHVALSHKSDTAPNYADQLKRLRVQFATAKQKLDKLYDLYMSDLEDEYTLQKMADLKDELKRLKDQIIEIESRQRIGALTDENTDRIISIFQKMLKKKQDSEFIKTLFSLTVKSVTVHPEKVKVALLVTQERFELPTP